MIMVRDGKLSSSRTTKKIPLEKKYGASDSKSVPSGQSVTDNLRDQIPSTVESIFENDRAVREIFAKNLRDRSATSVAFTDRAKNVFSKFNPSRFSPDMLGGTTYLKPDDDLRRSQKTVINNYIASIKNSKTNHSMRLSASDQINKMVSKTRRSTNSAVGTISLDDLISYVNLKLPVPNVFAGSLITECEAELKAKKRINEIYSKDKSDRDSEAAEASLDDDVSTDDDLQSTSKELVKEKVNLQMDTARSPESKLLYSIPHRSDQGKISDDIGTFELRSGPSDVTAYHDFYNLQMAFENIWTEMFDSQLASLGKQLYEEYVRLKDFSGADDGTDPAVNTIDDLKRLMDEIESFAEITAQNIPPALQTDAGDSKKNAGDLDPNDVVKDAFDVGINVLDPGGALLRAIAAGLGKKIRLDWDSFSRVSEEDTISVNIDANVNAVPTGMVQIALTTSQNITWWKAIQYTDLAGATSEVWTQDNKKNDSMLVNANQIKDGMLEFKKAKIGGIHTGMYVMGGLGKLKSKSRVTFNWIKD